MLDTPSPGQSIPRESGELVVPYNPVEGVEKARPSTFSNTVVVPA